MKNSTLLKTFCLSVICMHNALANFTEPVSSPDFPKLMTKIYFECPTEFKAAMSGDIQAANQVGPVKHERTEQDNGKYEIKYTVDTLHVKYYSTAGWYTTHIARLTVDIQGRPSYIPGLPPIENTSCAVEFINQPYDSTL